MGTTKASLTTRVIARRGKGAHAFADPVLELRVSGASASRKVRLPLPRILIGSSPAAQLQLEDRTVSALHCELVSDLEGLCVRDLGSKNGVFLRDRRVREAWIEAGDTLRLGQSKVKLLETDAFSERPLSEATHFFGLRGSSLAMRQLYALLAKAAAADAPVLLLGPTGTGKELAAEALVAAGPRSEGPLVVVDCSALPAGVAERELFGHERGGFTDATTSAPGAFERAHGGTLFLDEVGELPMDLQPKLLGALERKSVQRLGGTAPIPVDVRVIAATHRPLEAMVNAGGFRADLYYRLAALTVPLPPLSTHREDIPELVLHFLSQLEGTPTLSNGELARLSGLDYPGNVRELRNAVLRAALELPDAAPAPASAQAPRWRLDAPYRQQRDRLVAELERGYLVQLLEHAASNVSEAARISGLNRVHLYELLRRHRLSPRLGPKGREK